eukprot:CAMPEP_0194040408 /NCGR_PEP_ID=MMETSP0009_2-20130614/12421_1 /TAXON_ID=210454 /ORGANISM="Grammatophora oceanica, Strain CCMP 410" /LENGTH=529 /DNA_ID=CAMNT_0038683547 /DNA_START=121 /DNA_END=1710 /DNA_ORIENTATION=-
MAPRQRGPEAHNLGAAPRSVTPQRISTDASSVAITTAVPSNPPRDRRTLNEDSYREHTFAIEHEDTKSETDSMVPPSRNKKSGSSAKASTIASGKKKKKKRIEYFDLYLKPSKGDDNTISDMSGDYGGVDDDTLGTRRAKPSEEESPVRLHTVLEIPNKSKTSSGARSCESEEEIQQEEQDSSGRDVRRRSGGSQSPGLDKSSSHRRRSKTSSTSSTPSRSSSKKSSPSKGSPSKRPKKRKDEKLSKRSTKVGKALDTMEALDRALDITRDNDHGSESRRSFRVSGDVELPLPSNAASARKAEKASRSQPSEVEQLIGNLPHQSDRPNSRSLGRRHSSTGAIEIRQRQSRFDHSWRSEEGGRRSFEATRGSRQNAQWEHRDVNRHAQGPSGDAFEKGIAFFKLHVEAQKKKPIRRRRSFVDNVTPSNEANINLDINDVSRHSHSSCSSNSHKSDNSRKSLGLKRHTRDSQRHLGLTDGGTPGERRRARHQDFRQKTQEIMSEWEEQSRRKDVRRKVLRMSQGGGGDWEL